MLTLLAALLFLVVFAAVAAAMTLLRETVGRSAVPPDAEDPGNPAGEDETQSLSSFDWLRPVNAPAILREDSLSSISLWEGILARVDGIEMMRHQIAEAGMSWSVGRLTAMMLLSAAAVFAILWRMSWVASWVAFALSIAAGALPYAAVRRRRAARLGKFEEQFPEALDSLARSLRAGNALMPAMELLSRETPQPLGGELRRIVEERRLGMHWDVALQHFAERVPIVEVSIFVAAIQLQSRTGGKLHEVLGKLAVNMREAAALRGEAKSISSHGKLTGNILTALPFVIAAMMSYVNPPSMLGLWNHPTGNQLIWLSIGALAAAHFIIRKLADVKL